MSQISKLKSDLKEYLSCEDCQKHILNFVCKMKFHVTQYPNTRRLCTGLVKFFFDYKGQKIYSDYKEHYLPQLWDLQDIMFDCKHYNCEEAIDCLKIRLNLPKSEYIPEFRKIFNWSRNCKIPELPSSELFIPYEFEKESKLWLCSLPSPTNELVEEIKYYIESFLDRFGPRKISLPDPRATWSYGNQLYSDNHISKRDYEWPIHLCKGWDYQFFYTSNLQKREVWLPNKGYKANSTWWHATTSSIINACPYIVHNENLSDMADRLQKKWVPCRKVDLKGFGLQFPREYIIAFEEVFYSLYQDHLIKEEIDFTKGLFQNLSVRMTDNSDFKPNRGVGLGYFGNIMTLVIASILVDYDIVMMFNDDILVPYTMYDDVKEILEHFGFVLNDEKSGETYYSTTLFGGIIIRRNSDEHTITSTHSGLSDYINPLFNMDYHCLRKEYFLTVNWDNYLIMSYLYERIFGFEISRNEFILHPDYLGLNKFKPLESGILKGGNLRTMRTIHMFLDSDQRTTRDKIFQDLYHQNYSIEIWQKIKDLDFKRRSFKRKSLPLYNTYEWDNLHPLYKYKESKHDPPFKDHANMPYWIDMKIATLTGETFGTITRGFKPETAARHWLEFFYLSDPIRAWQGEGVDYIESTHWRHFLHEEDVLIYNLLKYCILIEGKVVKYAKPIDNSTNLSGLNYLASIRRERNFIVENYQHEKAISFPKVERDNIQDEYTHLEEIVFDTDNIVEEYIESDLDYDELSDGDDCVFIADDSEYDISDSDIAEDW